MSVLTLVPLAIYVERAIIILWRLKLNARINLSMYTLHAILYSRWGILFSHPADFTPVCTTELGVVAQLIPEFTKRNVKVIALSCDPVESHKGWIKDIVDYGKLPATEFPYPIISDPNRELAVQLGMVDPVEKDKAGLPLTCRAVSSCRLKI